MNEAVKKICALVRAYEQQGHKATDSGITDDEFMQQVNAILNADVLKRLSPCRAPNE